MNTENTIEKRPTQIFVVEDEDCNRTGFYDKDEAKRFMLRSYLEEAMDYDFTAADIAKDIDDFIKYEQFNCGWYLYTVEMYN